MEPIISVRRLGKSYRIRSSERKPYRTLRDDLADLGKNLLQGKWVQNNSEEFWALKDINFDIYPGEVVGIVGCNGAGKSTLLKILSRVIRPTTGEAVLNGRVASLLEVGTGFHPELTGRENIFMSGAILGMKRTEILKKFDEIVDFAEIESFLDTPVKRYSSGMYVRLAFAVAAHLEPEILLVDEVLAVGDAAFQKKCLGRMENVATKEGRTVLFVSHNMTALQSLCKRAILLERGSIVKEGPSNDVVTCYLKTNSICSQEKLWEDTQDAPGNDYGRLRRICILPEQEVDFENISVLTPIKIEIEYWNFLPNVYLNFSLVLYNKEDICIFNSFSEPEVCAGGLLRGTCYIPGNLLNNDIYRIRLLIVKDSSIPLIDQQDIAAFEVHDITRKGKWYGKWIGAVRPRLKWKTEFIDAKNEADKLT
ncbi:MAG TPA: ABC transporter ATP-binding protein [Stenomitos sp.]